MILKSRHQKDMKKVSDGIEELLQLEGLENKTPIKNLVYFPYWDLHIKKN